SDEDVANGKTVTLTGATLSGADAGNYSLGSVATTTADITPAPTTITVQNALADCDGNDVFLTATVKTLNIGIQGDVDSEGGIVTFKTGATVLGVVNATSVSGGVFSNSFAISLPLGGTYNISAEFVPNSGNLSGSQTSTTAQLTVLEAFITPSVTPNVNGNVVIFDGAHSSMGLPSSTILTATYQPSGYSGVTYKWYSRNVGDTFSLIPGATTANYQIVANGDFVKEYMVELIVNGNCAGNKIFSKVISVDAACGKEGQNKVAVCHVTPNGKRKTICVSYNAVEALLSGSPGSYIGDCSITYRMEEEPELITVPWNTPLPVINEKIAAQSENWFDLKKISLNISAGSYNPLASGFYELKVNVEENEWLTLEEPITVNVLVKDKPLATDIKLSNSILLRNIHNGNVIGVLSTVDPVDDQHTYFIAEHPDFELVGKSLIWKGTEIPQTARITVLSTDRAGQTIERAIELSREPRFGDFHMFPNPADSDVNLEVELDQSTNVGIRIFDAVGRLVYEEEGVQSGSSTYQINIDHLSPGLYTVQVKTGKLVMNKRLIKK
ncbi:T9SS type A sorting domain-containing protein, partial [Algoriphagus sp. D3-2-R+10]|uniref:T9SS type A sorting domain-containing protein n=1 Tax=Algoriphagus aurantiacus TaxID=3103948 RepID=UPI002B387D14